MYLYEMFFGEVVDKWGFIVGVVRVCYFESGHCGRGRLEARRGDILWECRAEMFEGVGYIKWIVLDVYELCLRVGSRCLWFWRIWWRRSSFVVVDLLCGCFHHEMWVG